MCYRGSRTGADDREFAGVKLVEGGVRGIFGLSAGQHFGLSAL
jgi:hypothetical protein